MKTITAYRLFRLKESKPEVLFHSFDVNGKKTKQVPLNEWMQAEEKQSWNPGKKEGPGFISGWHIVLSKDECIEYLKKFKNTEDIRICKVLVKDIRPKPRSKVTLAKWMFLPKKDWDETIKYFGTMVA
jgi:hypothetical protein